MPITIFLLQQLRRSVPPGLLMGVFYIEDHDEEIDLSARMASFHEPFWGLIGIFHCAASSR